MNPTRLFINNRWLMGYLLLLAAHLVAIVTERELLRFATKPLLMAWLLVYFITNTPGNFPNRLLVLLAIGLSWLGDVFLMQEGNFYFMAGLTAFLLAHLLYARVFWKLKHPTNQPRRWREGWLISIGLYVVIFNIWLFPYLETALKIPVLLYSLAIGVMLLLAVHIRTAPGIKSARLLIPGAILFIISDSMLAINTFIQPFPLANVAIMASYGLAQLFIIHSIARLS